MGKRLPNARLFAVVAFLGMVWLATLKIPEIPIVRLLETLSGTGEVETLLLAAMALVALNTARAIPLYLACFNLGEGIGPYGMFLPLVAIPLSHLAIGFLSGGKGHHFGVPSLMGIVFTLQLLIWKVPGKLNRSIALSLFLASFQWLDLAPILTRYGFGKGEYTATIKMFADIMGHTRILNILGFGGFIVTFIGALMSAALLVSIDRNVRQFRRLMKQKELLSSLREASIRARMTSEINSLVHDLRRPLTTIQGMVDVLAATAARPEQREYAECAGTAAVNMNCMIDEILNEDMRSLVSAHELLDYTMSQICTMPWHRHVSVEHFDGGLEFWGNKIHISRAIANMIENAAQAAKEAPTPRIVVSCFAEDGFVTLLVRDNGHGVPGDFSIGVSGHGSTGLGLTMVQRVAQNHNGTFTLRNGDDGGAVALLRLSLLCGRPHMEGGEA